MTPVEIDRRMTQQKLSYMHRSWKIARIVLLTVCLMYVGSLSAAVPPSQRIIMGTFSPYYSPKLAQVPTGIAISWDNPTAAVHSIKHDECESGERCAFDSGPIGPNGSFTVKELSPGNYPYHCTFHPIMRGVLVVFNSHIPSET